MMKRQRIKTTAITLLCMFSFLTGCGKETAQDVPALLEPVSVNEAFRPAEMGEVGELKVALGTVKPQEYPHFYSTSVTITEILVEIGDYVEAGDVLAYGDVEEAKEQLSDLKEQLSKEQKSYKLSQQILSLELQQEIDEVTKATLKENANYDKKLYEYRVRKLKEEIQLQEKLIANGTLIARHSGYVSYIKNLAYGNVAGAAENIVMIYDPKEIYIELGSCTTMDYEYQDYELKYVLKGEEKIPITEREYTSQEKVLAKASGKKLYIRLECPEGMEYAVGESCPVYFMERDLGQVLIVGNDSVFEDGQGTYVFIKNADGKKERREIKIGEKNSYYTQVVSGLQDGELVFYENDTQLPADYVTCSATRTEFTVENFSQAYQVTYGKTYVHEASHNGTVLSMAVEEEQEVEKGQLLYEIQSDTGKAALTGAKKQIERQKESNKIALEEMDKQIAESVDIQLEILKLQRQQMVLDQEETLNNLINEYNKLKEGNDGTGIIKVYAENSGVVRRIAIEEGDEIYAGETLFSIQELDENLILVQMKPIEGKNNATDNIAELGEIVSIKGKDGAATGSCIGWICAGTNMENGYAYTDENGAHLSYCSASGYEYSGFYVRLSEEDHGKDVFKGEVAFSSLFMKNIIVLPESVVYSEEVNGSSSEKNYYVWKVKQETLIKQYVTVGKNYNGRMVILSGVTEGDILAEEVR